MRQPVTSGCRAPQPVCNQQEEKMKRFLTAGLTAANLVIASMAFAEAPQTLTLSNHHDNASFDRAKLQTGYQIQYWMPVFDTLLVLDPESRPQPNIATSWAYNDDNTVLNLTLRDGISFTDGTPLDAEAVKANMEYLKAGAGQNTYMVDSIESIEILSSTELNLHLIAPDPGLVNYLGLVAGAMASPASLGTEASQSVPVGSGAYVLDTDETVAGRQYVYERNPDYWNPEAYPYDKLVIVPMSDMAARVNALQAGQVNAATASPQYVRMAEATGLQINTTDTDWNGLFLMDRNGEQIPALADVRVRQALNYAFDKQAMVDNLLLGYGEVTSVPFSPTSMAYDPSLEEIYDYNPEKARELLAEAGYADGFTITMPLFPNEGQFSPYIEQQLADVGITVEWENVPQNAMFGALLSGKFGIFRFSMGNETAWQDLRKFAFVDSPWNMFKVEDPEIEALSETAQYATGDEQVAAMKAVGRYVVENAYFAPFFRKRAVYLTDAGTDVAMQSQNIVPWIRDFSPKK